MKKLIKPMALALSLCILFSSCASILGGPITEAQKRKPSPEEPKREVRAGFLVLDILFLFIPLVVDLSTGAIYKPEPTKPTGSIEPIKNDTQKNQSNFK